MDKVTAYKCSGGALEVNPERAFAWELNKLGDSISFSTALFLIENRTKITEIFNELDKELRNKQEEE